MQITFRRNALWHATVFSLSLTIAGTVATSVRAQENDSTPEQANVQELDTINVVGSRRYGRASDTASPVPVDIIPMDKAAEQGAQFDLAQTLQYTAPSFTSTRQTGADGADLVDGAALRGLGSDQTLVLVNGKRHHTVSLVNIYGARNRGNTGTDLNAIPILAIDQIEILRDGAAAQYGSDAIAGVMNIAMKRQTGCESVAGYGQYSRGDGENWLASAYCGFDFAKGGRLSLTGEWQDRGRSDRSEPEDNPRIIGDSEVQNSSFYLNGDMPVGELGDFYITAGMQDRDASSAAFARGGIGSDDIPSRNSAAMYPDGFVPFIDGELEDRFSSFGLRGDIGDWYWDASYTYGFNELNYNINNTLNASIANLDPNGMSPSSFDAGGFSFQQDTFNFDVSRYFDGIMNGMNMAYGLEQRNERYKIRAGEPGSYIDADGAGVGGNPGSQGFPGFQPGDVTDSERDSWALYGDIEVDLSERMMTAFAVRYEDYSDFGNTFDGKLAASFKASDALLLRGSASTGFRAPSLQQKYFSSTITDFIGGVPVDVMIASNDSVLAQAAGIPNLIEETSTATTLGFTYSPRDNLSLTFDAYQIDIDDRIILSGDFDNSDPDIGPILDSLGVGLARFFFNSVDTQTQGIDLTIAHDMDFAGGTLNSFIAYNYSKTEVTQVHTPPNLIGREDVLLSERDRLFVENGAPREKAVIGFDFNRGAWNPSIKLIHFGSQTLGTWSGTSGGVPNQEYSAKTSADISLSYAFNDNAKLTIGAANIFDVFPTRQNPDETDNGHVFESVQFGLNGTSYFTRFWYKF